MAPPKGAKHVHPKMVAICGYSVSAAILLNLFEGEVRVQCLEVEDG